MNAILILKTAICLLLIAFVAATRWSARFRSIVRSRLGGSRQHIAWGILGVLGIFGWINLGRFHHGAFIHHHEMFHYVIGSKYFKELGHTLLYHCAFVAEATFGRVKNVERRRVRDLESKNLVFASRVLGNPEPCRQAFTIPRWNAFRADVAFFGQKAPDEEWARVFVDHGYNATPVWNLVGSALTNLGPVSDLMLTLLALIDPALLLLAFFAVRWAFGGKVLAVMLFALGFGAPWDFGWTGGAFGRSFFVVAAIVGVCLLKKNRPVLGGAFLGGAALFQLFPVLLFAGSLVRLARGLVVHRKWDREAIRIVGGAVLAASLVVPLSFVSPGGPEAYSKFSLNITRHASRPNTSEIGLRPLVAFDPDKVDARTQDYSREDPYAGFHEARKAVFQDRVAVFGLVALTIGVLFVLAILGLDSAWEATVAGVLMVPIVVAPACYYLVLLILVAPLLVSSPKRLFIGLGFLATTQFAALVFDWRDERSVFVSAMLLVTIVWLLRLLARRQAIEPDTVS